MKADRKIKLCISLSPGVVGRIDQRAKASHASRSAVVEEWLQEAERRARDQQLAAEVESYYADMSSAERSEDDAISAATGRIARTLDLDEGPRKAPRRGPPAGRR
jgi:hypothetical protein